MSRLQPGTKVRWSADNDRVWTVIEWQPKNGPDGAYWIVKLGEWGEETRNGVAGEDEIEEVSS